MSIKKEKRQRRHRKIRMKIHGTAKCPRLCVSRTNQHIYAQIINDENAKVLLAVSDLEIKKNKINKTEIAREVGKLIAKKAGNPPAGGKIEKVVFDRGGLLFHGRVKALAEGAREGGLKF